MSVHIAIDGLARIRLTDLFIKRPKMCLRSVNAYLNDNNLELDAHKFASFHLVI